MSGVDDRVVNMTFNNSGFAKGIQSTLDMLSKLKSSLDFSSSEKSMDSLETTASKFSLGPVGASIDGISSKFLAMSTIGITALATITTKAVDAGLQMAKSLTIAPILDGLHEYETQLNSVQTILANTNGKSNIDDVNAALQSLNTYSDKTIYNFSEMARNIGTFTAAGVDLDTSVDAIKGIANLAAISGSSSDQASTAMYQLSQAIASGSVKLQDWNSVVNSGMGGEVFQKALFDTAKAMGKITSSPVGQTFDQWKDAGNSFRDSLQDGWITADVLTDTLKQFTGELTDEQLKAMGFNAEQIAQIQQMGQMGVEAATKVKTLSQLVDTLKEAVGSGWAQTWQTVFGNIDEAKDTFTAASNTLGGFVSANATARNKVLQDWKDLGGRTALIDGIKAAFTDLISVIKPIKDAFREIFPAKTGQDLYDLTVTVRDFFQSLKLGDKASADLKRTFAGLFAALDIGFQVIKGILGVFGTLLGEVTGASGGFLGFTANIGDWLVKVDTALKESGKLSDFFKALGQVLLVPIDALKTVGKFIAGLFDGFDSKDLDAVQDGFGRIGDRFSTLTALGERFSGVWGGIVSVFKKIQEAVQPFIDTFVAAMQGIGVKLQEAFSTGNFDGVLDAINTALFGGVLLLVARFFKKGIPTPAGGFFDSISEAFEGLTGNLKAMQQNIKADTLLKIAGAVGILTLSVVALSLIDSAALTKAMTAMAVGFGELLAAMAILVKISGAAGYVKIPIIAASMILLATSLLILSAAVKIISTMSWEELAKGMAGIAGMLALISAAVIPLSANSSGMIAAGTGLIAISIGLAIMVGVLKSFAEMPWEEIGHGLAGVSATLVAVGLAMRLMPSNMAVTGAGLILVAAGLKLLAMGIETFAQINVDELVHGLGGIGAALVVIGLAMRLMPSNMIANAAGLILVGVALQLLSKAVSSMAGMSLGDLGKGIGAIAVALAVLAGALYLMTGTLAGAAALLVAAGALAILTPVLITLGHLDIKTIVTALATLAAVFVILGLAALALTPVIVPLLAVSAALLILGAGLALVGVGMLATATAFQIFATIGAAGIVVMIQAFKDLLDLIPYAIQKIGEGLVELLKTIKNAAPEIVATFIEILGGLIDGAATLAPKMGALFLAMLTTILGVLVAGIPDIAAAGLQLLTGLLEAIANNLGGVISAATDVIVAFLNGIGQNLPRIIDAGAQMIIDFINGLARTISQRGPDLTDALFNLGTSIVEGIVKGIASLPNAIFDKLKSLASSAFNGVKSFLGINSPSKLFMPLGSGIVEGMSVGADKTGDLLKNTLVDKMDDAHSAVADAMSKLPELLANIPDLKPTITPVLDLSQVTKDATGINGIINTSPLNVNGAAGQAANIANTQAASAAEAASAAATPAAPMQVTFQQTNTSPESLSELAIYRNTKNQLAMFSSSLESGGSDA